MMTEDTFVKLDASTIKALNLFPTGSSKYDKSNLSIYQLLNHCRTQVGQRLLEQWIRQPLVDINLIRERQDLVEFLRTGDAIRNQLNNVYLRRTPDLERITKKFEGSKATLVDACKVYEFVIVLPEIGRLLESQSSEAVRTNFIAPLQTAVEDFQPFVELIQKTVDFNRLNDDREPMIKAEYDEELQKLDEQLQELDKQANRLLKSVCKKFDLDSSKCKLEANSETGFTFRVTKSMEKYVRNLKGIKLVNRAKKTEIRFVNDDLEELSRNYIDIMSIYETQQKELVDELLKVSGTYSEVMQSLGVIVAKLDVLVSFAMFTRSGSHYVKPELLPKGSGKIIMIKVRHPCIEALPDSYYVPNDVVLDSEEHKFYLVTGPNMGGKSTYIRSAAVSVLLAQIGCYVPADSAVISIVDGIYTRVGSSDYQSEGVSTFMAEMIETSSILKNATENSFVIIDELGRGTSTYDGFGLSWQISLHIATNLKSYCFFATHFFELTDLTKEHSSIGNLHVKASTSADDLLFMYKVEKGSCDQSYGIHVAKLADFPSSIIESAKKIVQEFEGFRQIGDKQDELRKYVLDYLQNIDVDKMNESEINEKISQLQKFVKHKWFVKEV